MARKTDKRTLKTVAAIEDAFLDLMRTEGFDRVTVSQIVAAVGINRSTFYAHFDDKYALLDAVESRMLDELERAGESLQVERLTTNRPGDAAGMDAIARTLSEHLMEYSNTVQLLLDEHGDAAFPAKLSATVASMWTRHGLARSLSVPRNYAIEAATGVVVNVVVAWARGGYRESPQEMAALLVRMMNGLSAALFAPSGDASSCCTASTNPISARSTP